MESSIRFGFECQHCGMTAVKVLDDDGARKTANALLAAADDLLPSPRVSDRLDQLLAGQRGEG